MKTVKHIYRVSPNGSLDHPRTLPAPLCGGRLEPQLTHRGDQVGLLHGLRDVRGEETVRPHRVGAAVCTNSKYRRVRVLVVGGFDIPCGAFAIN